MLTQAEVNAIITRLRKIQTGTQANIKNDLREGANFLASAIKGRTPVGSRIHKRYKAGRRRAAKGAGVVVATYRPGNLRKSFQVLPLRRTKSALYVGPKYGRTPDGYYAHMVEFGTKYNPSQPFVGPTVASVGPVAQRFILNALQQRVKNIWEQ